MNNQNGRPDASYVLSNLINLIDSYRNDYDELEKSKNATILSLNDTIKILNSRIECLTEDNENLKCELDEIKNQVKVVNNAKKTEIELIKKYLEEKTIENQILKHEMFEIDSKFQNLKGNFTELEIKWVYNKHENNELILKIENQTRLTETFETNIDKFLQKLKNTFEIPTDNLATEQKFEIKEGMFNEIFNLITNKYEYLKNAFEKLQVEYETLNNNNSQEFYILNEMNDCFDKLKGVD